MFPRIIYALLVVAAFSHSLISQSYWQQKADYKIEVDMDETKNQYNGAIEIDYINNSPDTLDKLYFYLFYNAFQPGSMMDVKSRTIIDPDSRVGDRISKLTKAEIGYQNVKLLTVNGKPTKIHVEETILEVDLSQPILPGSSNKIALTFDAQVPLQVRRAGRDNDEGIRYSMSQWFPKLCEYDYQGWHAHPYVGREFHGIWGDYDVTIHMNKDYVVAAGGVLTNPDEVGFGYGKEPKKKPKKLTWHFEAKNVIDFMWAADQDYKHTTYEAHDGTMLHFFYQPGEKTNENWEKLPKIMDEALKFMNANYGKYPYPVYAFIQGGDGGMEYPMGTLITGERSLGSLVGVSVHEWMHSWYQMMLATNEALYPWMDEGFTSYASNETMNHLVSTGVLSGKPSINPQERTIKGFENFATSGYEEPLITHSDHYVTNSAYGTGSYSKGSLTLVQLSYVLGDKVMREGLLRYFNTWKFKHPNPNDFFRVMEKTSGMELDWFKEYWVNTTHTIDYSIDTVGDKTILLSKKGAFPMPLDLMVTSVSGKKYLYYIPLSIMRGEKEPETAADSYKVCKDWHWTHPTYELDIDIPASDIKSVQIDPSGRMLDIDRSNNVYPKVVEINEK